MSQPYVGEVRLVGFNFAPAGWAFCAGQLTSISENETLFNLIGTTYGGDGQNTFGLPDLQGRIPLHQGQLAGGGNYIIGQPAGVESVTINITQYPQHNHALFGSTNSGLQNSPTNNITGNTGTRSIYGPNPASAMSNVALSSSGGGNLPHENRQPFQVLSWVISLFGVFPTQG